MDIDDAASLALYKSAANGIASSSSSMPVESPLDPVHAASKAAIANLRRRLSPLVASDMELANRLSGGIQVSGSGKGGVYVRSGWQARTIENALGFKRQPRENGSSKKSHDSDAGQDALVQDVARMLEATKEG